MRCPGNGSRSTNVCGYFLERYPVAESLLAKGAGLGTILAFMMSVTTISFPSLVMCQKQSRKNFWEHLSESYVWELSL